MREAIARGLDGPGIRYICCNLKHKALYWMRGPSCKKLACRGNSVWYRNLQHVSIEVCCRCSPLDVHPESWAHVPGYEEEIAHRKAKLAAVKVRYLHCL